MTAELISRTGRVQSWLDNPESRLPVSCTVFVVEDSMEGPEGIEASWKFTSHALKELADLVYVCYQYAENMGWFLDEALDRVHKSNMSKLDEDGKPIYRKDGKVLKGPNYKPPTLEDLF